MRLEAGGTSLLSSLIAATFSHTYYIPSDIHLMMGGQAGQAPQANHYNRFSRDLALHVPPAREGSSRFAVSAGISLPLSLPLTLRSSICSPGRLVLFIADYGAWLARRGLGHVVLVTATR